MRPRMDLEQNFANSVFVSVSMSMSVSLSCLCLCALKICVQQGNYHVDPQSLQYTRWCRSLKGISIERRWVNQSEILTPLHVGVTYPLRLSSVKTVLLDHPFKARLFLFLLYVLYIDLQLFHV
jgi:hypothetical protein